MIGASWSLQFIAFAEAFALGLIGGIPSLLFLRKARPLERALTDFTAVMCNLALYILAIELGSDGAVKAFTLIAYALGLFVFFKCRDSVKNIILRRRERAAANRKSAEKRPR